MAISEEQILRKNDPWLKEKLDVDIRLFTRRPSSVFSLTERLSLIVNGHVFFASQLGEIRRTRLQKLFFLAELHHYARTGELAFGLHFISYKYGPFSPELYPFNGVIKEALVADGRIVFVDDEDRALLAREKQTDVTLPPEILQSCKEVLHRFGHLHIQTLMTHVNSLIVYQVVAFGCGISWAGAPPEEVLDVVSGEVSIHAGFDKFRELRQYQPHGWRKATPQEVIADDEVASLIA